MNTLEHSCYYIRKRNKDYNALSCKSRKYKLEILYIFSKKITITASVSRLFEVFSGTVEFYWTLKQKWPFSIRQQYLRPLNHKSIIKLNSALSCPFNITQQHYISLLDWLGEKTRPWLSQIKILGELREFGLRNRHQLLSAATFWIQLVLASEKLMYVEALEDEEKHLFRPQNFLRRTASLETVNLSLKVLVKCYFTYVDDDCFFIFFDTVDSKCSL